MCIKSEEAKKYPAINLNIIFENYNSVIKCVAILEGNFQTFFLIHANHYRIYYVYHFVVRITKTTTVFKHLTTTHCCCCYTSCSTHICNCQELWGAIGNILFTSFSIGLVCLVVVAKVCFVVVLFRLRHFDALFC